MLHSLWKMNISFCIFVLKYLNQDTFTWDAKWRDKVLFSKKLNKIEFKYLSVKICFSYDVSDSVSRWFLI